MNVQDLNAMTLAFLKEYYASLTNPMAVEGDKRRKENWIDAITKSMNAPKEQEIVPDEEIPFYWEDEEDEEYYEVTEEDLERENEDLRELDDPEIYPSRDYQYSHQEIFGIPISFGWTAGRLLAGIKTVTRRTWNERYTSMFIKAYKQGKLVQAFDKDRRYGGKLIGYLKVSDIYRESLFNMPELDASAEGFPELSKEEFIDKFFSDIEGYDNSVIWVIRFEFIPLLSHSEILERHGFKLFGDVKDCWFMSRYSEIKEELNGWKIMLTPGFKRTSSGNVFFQKIDLINIDSGELWTKDVSNTPISKKCLLIARKAILDIGYNLPTVHHNKDKKLTHSKYESKAKR